MTGYRGNYGNLSQMTRQWLAHPPSGTPCEVRLIGQRCGEAGCNALVCGTDEQNLGINLDAHRRRCHA